MVHLTLSSQPLPLNPPVVTNPSDGHLLKVLLRKHLTQ